MSNFYIAIVSHGHHDYIEKNKELVKIAELNNVQVVIKDNIKESKLEEYAKNHNFMYVTTDETLGFGKNNNFIFNYSKQKLNARNEDWFIIFNPDVVITLEEFKERSSLIGLIHLFPPKILLVVLPLLLVLFLQKKDLFHF